MKYLFTTLMVLLLLTGCAKQECPVCEECVVTSKETVDSYTGASFTKIMLEGDDKTVALNALKEIDSDLATASQVAEENYVAPENEAFVEILSINPDGTPGISTIHAWRINDDDTLTTVLTDGQSARNLNSLNAKGTILVKGDSYYLLHLNTVNVITLDYSDENYENGLFNSSYSGANNKLSEYTITYEILAVEKVNLYLPN